MTTPNVEEPDWFICYRDGDPLRGYGRTAEEAYQDFKAKHETPSEEQIDALADILKQE